MGGAERAGRAARAEPGQASRWSCSRERAPGRARARTRSGSSTSGAPTPRSRRGRTGRTEGVLRDAGYASTSASAPATSRTTPAGRLMRGPRGVAASTVIAHPATSISAGRSIAEKRDRRHRRAAARHAPGPVGDARPQGVPAGIAPGGPARRQQPRVRPAVSQGAALGGRELVEADGDEDRSGGHVPEERDDREHGEPGRPPDAEEAHRREGPLAGRVPPPHRHADVAHQRSRAGEHHRDHHQRPSDEPGRRGQRRRLRGRRAPRPPRPGRGAGAPRRCARCRATRARPTAAALRDAATSRSARVTGGPD